jgi:uncharacterized membrane protein
MDGRRPGSEEYWPLIAALVAALCAAGLLVVIAFVLVALFGVRIFGLP